MTSEFEALSQSVQASFSGLTLGELLAKHPDVPRRTAQRWLAQLVSEGQVRAQGQGRARRYFWTQPAQTVSGPPTSIPISADAQEIWVYVEQPVQARQPVGYQRDFLDTYEPGKTYYLPASVRLQLRKMGQTDAANLPAGTYSRAILNRLLIDLSWASSQLEGNTYSRLDTLNLIEHGQVIQGKAALETQMILNHKTAIELLVDNVETLGFNRYTLLNLHSALSENLLPNPAHEGRIRQHIVEIGKSVYRPLSVPQQLEEALDTLLTKASQITDPFEQSFFVMVHLPYLQPFADINKRTSRLLANLPLIRANLCPLTFLGVSEKAYSRAVLGVYEMTRVELLRDLYVWAYERSTQEYLVLKQNMAEPDPVRLAWRNLIKQTIRDVVQGLHVDAMSVIHASVQKQVPPDQQDNVQALIVQELSRLHEGVLARYGLTPREFLAWKGASIFPYPPNL